MIKDSIPSSSLSAVSSVDFTQSTMVAAIERLKNDRYDSVDRIKNDLGVVQLFTSDHKNHFFATKCGLIEAVARAIILLHRFNELDQYQTRSPEMSLPQAFRSYFTELDKEQKKNAADILYKKQRVCAMIEYADKLCKTSKRLSTAEAKNAFEGATNGIERVYPADSIVQLVTGVKDNVQVTDSC
ncbi:hypothetical protein GQ42DRAFT_176214 [Ramicandelaber brevisporus]|nr:hypothetical protein GQ42DRAFT_176214 [Ramicandelaber brevisporus]